MARHSSQPFGYTADGIEVALHTLRNATGAQVTLAEYGATIVGLRVADRQGEFADVVLGYDNLAAYEQCPAYLGCVVGPVANRIAHSQFSIDGMQYQLEANNGAHHLHGGSTGLHRQVWRTQMIDDVLVMSAYRPHGTGGYPGDLNVTVRYRWTDDNELCIDYQAVTDRPTPVNLSNHAYFNLCGHDQAGTDGALSHELQLPADTYLPTDSHRIPLERIDPVSGTPMDFSTPCTIGSRIDSDFEQLHFASGYDHCWVIGTHDQPAIAAVLTDPVSGRRMTLSTTQPGLQFYTANHLCELAGKDGQAYGRRGALCLETQHFPDAVNRPSYPSVLLQPGEQYRQSAVFRFDCI